MCVSGTASAVSRKDGHLVSFFVTVRSCTLWLRLCVLPWGFCSPSVLPCMYQLAMMILVNAFMIWSLKNQRKMRPCRKFGPLILTLLALPLVMADLSRHVRLYCAVPLSGVLIAVCPLSVCHRSSVMRDTSRYECHVSCAPLTCAFHIVMLLCSIAACMAMGGQKICRICPSLAGS
jgi:hypothetical protein